MLLYLKSRSSRRLARHGVDTAVVNFCRSAARQADEVVMVCRFTRDVGVRSIGEIEPLNESLLSEQIKVTKDRGAPDPKAAPIRIKE
jgi:hypothetical protein